MPRADVTRALVTAELDAFARTGYIRHVQPQTRRLAAPIRHADGTLAGALAMGGTPFTIPDNAMPEFGGQLIESARRLSAALDWPSGSREER
jgi:DNA-binding IclR family transcriptional regulator